MYNQYQPQYNSHSSITWVQGVEGAKAFQLYPNSNALLMDSENDGIFYIKTADNIGMCNLRTFKYEEIQNVPKENQEYVTRAEFNELLKSLGGLSNEQTVSGN